MFGGSWDSIFQPHDDKICGVFTEYNNDNKVDGELMISNTKAIDNIVQVK